MNHDVTIDFRGDGGHEIVVKDARALCLWNDFQERFSATAQTVDVESLKRETLENMGDTDKPFFSMGASGVQLAPEQLVFKAIDYLPRTGRLAAPALVEALRPVFTEIEKAVRKFPTWPTDPLHALAVLGEEFGELTKATLQMTYEPHKTSMEEMRTEAIQTAAMALRFYLSLDRYVLAKSEQHEQALAMFEGNRDD